MKTSNKPDIPYIMKVLAEVYSKQYGVELTITATLKEGATIPNDSKDE